MAHEFSWPVDADGKPMVLISMGCSEKVGLPKFSNVDIGPASIARFVVDDEEAITEGLRGCLSTCEQIIAEEREAILELVKSAQPAE
jgi:hypothetical protein